MKVVTWNVNGIRAREDEFLRLLDEEKPDVAMLQETKATAEQLPASLYGLLGLPAYHSIWHGSAGYSGVSVHLRKDVFERPRDAHPPFDFETRVAEAHAVKKSGEPFVFVSMYLPNGGKDYQAKLAFMRALATYPDDLVRRLRADATFATENIVVAGDLNVARAEMDVHETERKPRATGQRPEERKLFEQFLAAGLVDVCRTLAPEDRELFTWWPYWNEQRARNVGWRIDYVLATRALAARAKESRVRRDFGTSDHAPVVVTFDP